MRVWLFACVLLLASCVSATHPTEVAASAASVRFPDPPPPTTTRDPIRFRAGLYRLDSRHTTVTWRVRHYGLSMFTARIDREHGSLTFDPVHPEASHVEVVIDVNTVSTGVLDPNGGRSFDNDIAAALGVTAHPQLTFASTSLDRTNAETGLLHGNLSCNGVAKPVVLEVHFTGGDVKSERGVTILAFTGRTTIRRSDFAIAPDWGGDLVGDDVEILIEAEFGRSDPT